MSVGGEGRGYAGTAPRPPTETYRYVWMYVLPLTPHEKKSFEKFEGRSGGERGYSEGEGRGYAGTAPNSPRER